MKKNYYVVCQSAEGESFGLVCLTAEEAELIQKVTNCKNWERKYIEGWSGGFSINMTPLTDEQVENIKDYQLPDLFYGDED